MILLYLSHIIVWQLALWSNPCSVFDRVDIAHMESTPYVSPVILLISSLFRLISSHHEYPTDTIIYLGNTSARVCPSDEILAPNSFFQTMVVWQYIESQVLSSYRCELKYKNASPTVETKKPDPQKIAEQELQKIKKIIDQMKK